MQENTFFKIVERKFKKDIESKEAKAHRKEGG